MTVRELMVFKMYYSKHMSRVVWDAECDQLKEEMNLSATDILIKHGFNKNATIEICTVNNLTSLSNISDVVPLPKGGTPVETAKLWRLSKKCRLVEGFSYTVRFEMNLDATSLLYKYSVCINVKFSGFGLPIS